MTMLTVREYFDSIFSKPRYWIEGVVERARTEDGAGMKMNEEKSSLLGNFVKIIEDA